MSYDCLDNFIGIRQLCTEGAPVPLSGLYIDQLEGISIKKLASYSDGKYPSAYNMINTIVADAIKDVFEEAKQVFHDDFIFNTAIDTAWTGEIERDTYLAPEAVEKGMRLQLNKTPLMCLRLHKLILRANTTINAKQIIVRDGDTETTYEVDLVAGQDVEICTPYLSTTGCLDIVWDTSDIAPADGTTAGTYYYKGCTNCNAQQKRSRYVWARGLNAGIESSDAYGIRAEVTIECCIEKAMCLIAHHLKYPILYKAGIKLFKECQSTDRLNFIAIHSQEWLEDKIDEWEQTDYKEKFEIAAKGLRRFMKNIDPNCFECNTTQHGYVRPA